MSKKDNDTQIKKPTAYVLLRHNQIRDIIYKATKTTSIYIKDNIYRVIQKSDMDSFLLYDQVDRMNYLNEWFDCDDFSLLLNARVNNWFSNAFGEIWIWDERTKISHALNIFLDTNMKLWAVEPQNDYMYILPSSWTYNLVKI